MQQTIITINPLNRKNLQDQSIENYKKLIWQHDVFTEIGFLKNVQMNYNALETFLEYKTSHT